MEAATWPELPTETEIYILPTGEIVVADLPVELAAHLTQLMATANGPVTHAIDSMIDMMPDADTPVERYLEEYDVTDQ